MILSGKTLTISKMANTVDTSDDTEFVSATVFKKARLKKASSDTESSISSCSSHIIQPHTPVEIYSESDGLRYLAGYVAKKLLPKHPNLGDPTKEIPNGTIPSWLQYLSFGGLIEPNEQFLEIQPSLKRKLMASDTKTMTSHHHTQANEVEFDRAVLHHDPRAL
ncbi:hypothetical protein NQ317_016199 [Molorchus minor]|uniref:Transposable element P transposase-like C-terminal domain-containing protein n=1 Tax=Molorchus minor TaxID=1323400 RepID=A0ABQ9J9C7_9CUCU|nr:hypothetical protein NQ317_016199 [Molorchus minor]